MTASLITLLEVLPSMMNLKSEKKLLKVYKRPIILKCTNIFLRVYERLHCIIYQWQNISIPSTHHHKHNHTERGKICFNPRSTYPSTICLPLGFYCIFDGVSYSDPYSDLYSVAIWIRLQNTDPDPDVVYKINYVKLPKFFLQRNITWLEKISFNSLLLAST